MHPTGEHKEDWVDTLTLDPQEEISLDKLEVEEKSFDMGDYYGNEVRVYLL